MTSPTPGPGFRAVKTLYQQSTDTLESITTESASLINGKKAENLTAAIQRHNNTSKKFCYAIIPCTIIGVASLIAAIVVWNLSDNFLAKMALCPPILLCLGSAIVLSVIYTSRKFEPIVLGTEEITV
jgi:hypothetical protein